MHMLFTDKEKEWIYVDKFGWPIKSGCPDDIKASINKKKEKINKQMEGNYGKRNLHESQKRS